MFNTENDDAALFEEFMHAVYENKPLPQEALHYGLKIPPEMVVLLADFLKDKPNDQDESYTESFFENN